MFRLEPHQLLYVYAGLCLLVILIAALVHTARRARSERAALRNVLKCGMCAFRFRNENGLLHPRCPNCGSLVERRRQSRL